MSKFSKKEAIKFGWEVVKKNFVFLLLILIMIFVFNNLIPNGLRALFAQVLGKDNSALVFINAVIGIVFLFVTLLLNMNEIRVALKLHDGKKAEYSDMWVTTSFVNFILGSLLLGVIVLAGFILLIVPGIILGIRLQFAPYLIVDKKLGPVEAIKKSWAMTQGSFWNLFLMGVLLILLNFVGLLVLFVGIFVTSLISIIAMAHVYRKLSA